VEESVELPADIKSLYHRLTELQYTP
jgi:hypothetical protein